MSGCYHTEIPVPGLFFFFFFFFPNAFVKPSILVLDVEPEFRYTGVMIAFIHSMARWTFLSKIYQELMKNTETVTFSRLCHVDSAFKMVFHRTGSCPGCLSFPSPHNIKEMGFCQRVFTLAWKMESEKLRDPKIICWISSITTGVAV